MGSIVFFIVWAALLHGLFLAILYMFSKKNRIFANKLLGLFLLAIILEAITAIWPYHTIGSYDIDEYFSLPDVVIFIPILFFHFVLEKLGNTHSYRNFLGIHYSLATVIGAVTFVNMYLFFFKDSSLTKMFGMETIYWAHFGIKLLGFLVTVYTFSIAAWEIRQFKKLVRNEFSDFSLLQMNWLMNFIYFLIPVILLWGIALFTVVFVPKYADVFDVPLFSLIAVFLYYLSYQAYLHPNLFDKLPKSILGTKNLDVGQLSKNIQKPQLSPDNIEALMLENKFFLKKDLTLHSFAEAIHMSPRKISDSLNRNFGKNFNEWVNDFRIQKARELIENDTENKLSIEGVGMESGFNSRSALYYAFKKKLGCSPGEFRKNSSKTPTP